MEELNTAFDIGPAFSWASIGLAVVTAVLQGLVAAMTFVTESSGEWTFRFRLARVEHVWWTFVAVLLLSSLVMSAVAFISGRGGDPVSVLALSSATFLAVVQYALPAWQQRRFVTTRWYAWTGDSRTGIRATYAPLCHDAAGWARLAAKTAQARGRLQTTPSDKYGWRLWPVPGLAPDPTDIFGVMTSAEISAYGDTEKARPSEGLFEPVDNSADMVSLQWGRRQNFTRRVSRAVLSMPLTLMRSFPATIDGYNGKGLVLAMGILGRNKGLAPHKLIFNLNNATIGSMERSSTWAPRPAKVLRSFYKQAMHTQYSGIGEEYVKAATELALLLTDMPHRAADAWLQGGLEHQSLEANHLLARVTPSTERAAVLNAHYESSYVSLILSLNSMNPAIKDRHLRRHCGLSRPDMFCTMLLCHARDIKTATWDDEEVKTRLKTEISELQDLEVWKSTACTLLGVSTWPAQCDRLLAA